MRTFATAILATIGAARVLDEVDVAFMKYIASQNKSYTDIEEFNMRFANFAKFDEDIKYYNSI